MVQDNRVRYVVAVSGGVDSVVLLHILARQLEAGPLVVAHFDHGIRPDSHQDRELVQTMARRYGLPFIHEEGGLGVGTSEAAAREARYAFLHRVRDAYGARAIATAHHADDVLETAVINLLRGTGRKGLSSLRSTDGIYRPLLRTPKAHIYSYARRHGLEWREDSTNVDTDFLRNHVRHNLLPRLDAAARQRLESHVLAAHEHNPAIDALIAEMLRLQPAPDRLDRLWFIMLPHAVSREVLAAWLRQSGISGFDRRLLEQLTMAAKTLAPGKRADVNGRYVLLVRRDELILLPR